MDAEDTDLTGIRISISIRLIMTNLSRMFMIGQGPKMVARRRMRIVTKKAGLTARFLGRHRSNSVHCHSKGHDMTLPSFHDANLTGFSWLKGDVRLEFTFPNNESAVLELREVVRLRVNGLREGNIVDEVLSFNAKAVSSNDQTVRNWVEFLISEEKLLPGNPGYHATDKSIQAVLNSVAIGSNQLLTISQSYGCEMACLYKTATLSLANSPPQTV